MNTLKTQLTQYFIKASPLRAFLEMVGIGIILLLALILTTQDLPPGELQNSVFIVLLSAVSLFALRMRQFSGHWAVVILKELVIGSGFVLALAGLLLYLALRLYTVILVEPLPGLTAIVAVVLRIWPSWTAAQSPAEISPLLTLAMLISCWIAYMTMRVLSWGWQFWQRLQQRNLIWAIANSQISLVLLGAFLAALFLVITSLGTFTPEERASLRMINNLVPLMVIVLVMMLLILIAVLPPAIVLAYFTARRTTRRIKTLVEATASVRAGHYETRVQVQGEDEVAGLQADFNAMADALQQAMTELAAERDAVTQLLASRRELMASISHELRTPVAIINGHLESIQSQTAVVPPESIAHDATIMLGETRRLQRILDDLFTLARAEVGQLDLHRQTVDIGALVRNVAQATASIYWQTQRVEIIADVEPDLPAVLVDHVRLEQVLHNLIRNGVRHTPPGGIVALSVGHADDQMTIQVKDTGEGIALEDLPHIWERFYRAENARLQDNRGSGLGLTLVKDLVEAMGGTVTVESQPGQGSCFTIQLPVV